mgnify:CR=1 FL=1
MTATCRLKNGQALPLRELPRLELKDFRARLDGSLSQNSRVASFFGLPEGDGILLIAVLAIALTIAACGGTATTTPTPTARSATEPAPTEGPANEDAVAAACEEFCGFCVTAEIDGSVISTGTGGFGSSFNNDCAAWAAGGELSFIHISAPTRLLRNSYAVF